MIIKNNFHEKGFALDLVLKLRLAASRKWPGNDLLRNYRKKYKAKYGYRMQLFSFPRVTGPIGTYLPARKPG